MTHVQQAPGTQQPPTGRRPPPAGASANPGWAWFAAVMIGVGGFFNLIDGLVGITNAHYYANIARTYNVDLVVTNTIRTWGWVALAFGIVMLATAVGVTASLLWARVLGVTVVGLNMIFQLAFLPAYPFWGLVILTLDVLVIYALVVQVRRTA